ncbi:MAG: NAD+ synthase [Chloroflexaceae bacterium]|nr:NAD+ synthase [Chloroflexaceae bacterium]
MQREIERASRHLSAVVQWEPAAPSGTIQRGEPVAGEGARSNGVVQNPLPVIQRPLFDTASDDILNIDCALVENWLVSFLQDEVTRRRGFKQVVLALSGGVDSSLVAFLCTKAFGPQNVLAIRMPYHSSSRESLEHAQLVIEATGICVTTVDITAAVDGYASHDPEMDSHRKGNVMSRMRMITLFDYSQKLGSLPIGTGNKTERLFGYFTWHGDDSPPVNPIGDLFKTQVWQLARYMGVPEVIVDKPASADLIVGQTDEIDLGISYPDADRILHYLLQGYSVAHLETWGFAAEKVALVKRRLDRTHWKRHLPSTAMLSDTAIGEYYLRPLDF